MRRRRNRRREGRKRRSSIRRTSRKNRSRTRKRFCMESKVRCEVIHPLYNAMGQLGLNSKEASIRPVSAGWPAQLTASTFN